MSIFACLIISSVYLRGNPNNFPTIFATGVEVANSCLNSENSFLKISKLSCGGVAYCSPTESFLCLTSIECSKARIFISLLQSRRLPSPKNSATRVNSLSKLLNRI